MKKTAFFTVCFLMSFTIVASAANIVSVEKTVDYQNQKIYINVQTDDEVDYFNLIVEKPSADDIDPNNADDVLFYAKQKRGGSFALNFPLNFGEKDFGLYKFQIGSDDLDKPVSDSFYLTSIDNYNYIQNALNTITDEKEFAKLLNDSAYVIGISDVDYSDDKWIERIKTVLNIRDESGGFDGFSGFIGAFTRAQRVCEINGADIDEVEGLLEQSMKLLELQMDDESTYGRLTEKQKKDVLNIFLKNAPYATDKDLSKSFSSAVFLNEINNSYESQFKTLLQAYNGDIALSDYFGLTNSEFTKLFKAVTGGSDYTNIDTFANAFNTAVAKIISDRTGGGGSGGSGGGSSGSGSRSGGSGGISGGIIGSAAANNNTNQYYVQSEFEFKDLKGYEWAEEAIYNLADKQIINGYDDGTFKPSENITREEFVKILTQALGFEPVRNIKPGFDDVDENAWYYPYITIAYDVGITMGKDPGIFGIGENITRQDMAVMLERCLSLRGVRLELKEDRAFTDDESMAEYAKGSIHALSAAGVINGYDDNTFRPHQSAGRAEAAKMVYYTLTNIYSEV